MDERQVLDRAKEKTKQLIEIGEIEAAKELLNKYKDLLKDDVEVYSIRAIIEIIDSNMYKAEDILLEGYSIDSTNFDLLYNLGYLYETLRKYQISLTMYTEALQNCSDKQNIKEVNEKIDSIKRQIPLKRNDKELLNGLCKLKLFNTSNNLNLQRAVLSTDSNMNVKVVQGTMEIANQMNTISKGLKNIGIDVTTVDYYPNYLSYRSDRTLDLNEFENLNSANIEMKKIASKLIAEKDIFHFHFGTSLTLDHSDLPLLEELGKKVIMQYWGSDVRLYSVAKKMNKYVKVKNYNEDLIKRKVEFLSKYIKHCFVDQELGEYVKNYHSDIHYVKQAIDLEKYKYIEKTDNNRLLIVHAPTSPEIKGTRYIIEAINNLKLKYDFDFELVQGLAHEEAVKVYRKADLIIDQILGGSYGLFSIESMALGKPVICWITDFMKEKYPKELPIISANPDNIEKKIEHLLKNRDCLPYIGIESRKYVEKHHNSKKVSNQILNIYNRI